MIDSSLEFKQEIRENTSMTLSATIKFADGSSEEFDGTRFMLGSVSFDDSTSSSSTFEVGAAIMNTFNCALNNADGYFDEYDFTGAKIRPVLKKTLSNGRTEVIPKGVYNIEQPNAYGNTIKLNCYDNMVKFEKPFKEVVVTYPIKLNRLLRLVCEYCGVALNTTSFTNENYEIKDAPQNVDSMSCLDVISAIAQMSCNYARIGTNGELYLKWYKLDMFNHMADGGTYNTTTTPYSDGDELNGGSFAYNDGDTFDGGTFTDEVPYSLYALSQFEICTDDVVITGIRATVDKETYVSGEEGYVLDIDNPFINEKNAQEIVDNLAPLIIGCRFRPFKVGAIGDPTLEAGDSVFVTHGENRYGSFITHINFKMGGYANIECSAETPSRNSAGNYASRTQAYVKARAEAEKLISRYDIAIQQLTELMEQSFGVFKTVEVLEDGSSIFYLHNKPLLADSSTRWKMTANTLMVSTDFGETWNAGIDSSGKAVVNVLSAIGVNADWINTGSLQVGGQTGNVDGEIIVLKSDGNEIFRANKDGLLFSDGVITWKAIKDNEKVVTDDNKTTKIGRDYINTLNIIAGSVDCKNLTGDYILGKVFASGNYGARMWASNDSKNIVVTSLESSREYGSNGNIQANGQLGCTGDLNVGGDISARGSKNRIVSTEDYNVRKLYCYEMPSPMFGDIGEGLLDNDGKCYIFIDDIFGETIDLDVQYQVFLQKYGQGDCWVSERNSSYFVVEGTVGLKFGWELKAIQLDYDNVRLEEFEKTEDDIITDTIEDLFSDLIDFE